MEFYCIYHQLYQNEQSEMRVCQLLRYFLHTYNRFIWEKLRPEYVKLIQQMHHCQYMSINL